MKGYVTRLTHIILCSPSLSVMLESTTHWHVQSAWSKAGVGTNIVLELKTPSPLESDHDRHANNNVSKKRSRARIAFDMGATPCFDDAIPAKYVFLSHGHIDHVGALFSHARAHAVSCGGEAPTYFVPAQLLPQIEQCRNAMSLIDSFTIAKKSDDKYSTNNVKSEGRENLLKMKLIPVKPGDEFPLKGITYGSKTNFFMRAFEVDHAGHAALGYIIGSRTKAAGLKPEYQHLNGAAIRELVQSGITVQADPVEKIEVAYSGDTCARGLMKKECLRSPKDDVLDSEDQHLLKSAAYLDQAFQAEMLICELTFLDSSEDETQRRRSEDRGHLHITDLHDIFASHGQLNKHSDARCILFYHLSGRYAPASRALDYICAGLPLEIRNSCHVAIKSLFSDREKLSNDGLAALIESNGCISIEDYLRWRENNKSADEVCRN